MVRLAAGRDQLSREADVLCFMAGANSIFVGDKLLTTSNPAPEADAMLLSDLGLTPMEPRGSKSGNAQCLMPNAD